MPDAVGTAASLADVGSNCSAELVRPAADGLVADIDAALRQQIFDLAKAHRETIVEPDHVTDDIRRKPVPLEGYLLHRPSLTNGERFALV